MYRIAFISSGQVTKQQEEVMARVASSPKAAIEVKTPSFDNYLDYDLIVYLIPEDDKIKLRDMPIIACNCAEIGLPMDIVDPDGEHRAFVITSLSSRFKKREDKP